MGLSFVRNFRVGFDEVERMVVLCEGMDANFGDFAEGGSGEGSGPLAVLITCRRLRPFCIFMIMILSDYLSQEAM